MSKVAGVVFAYHRICYSSLVYKDNDNNLHMRWKRSPVLSISCVGSRYRKIIKNLVKIGLTPKIIRGPRQIYAFKSKIKASFHRLHIMSLD